MTKESDESAQRLRTALPEPSPYPLEFGTWKLVAPSGKEWTAESPIRAVSAEQADRIPANVRLMRIYAAVDEMDELDAREAIQAVKQADRYWEAPCDECSGMGKVDVSEALHVDGRYMGDQLLRETCDACAGFGFTICIADIPKEIQHG